MGWGAGCWAGLGGGLGWGVGWGRGGQREEGFGWGKGAGTWELFAYFRQPGGGVGLGGVEGLGIAGFGSLDLLFAVF